MTGHIEVSVCRTEDMVEEMRISAFESYGDAMDYVERNRSFIFSDHRDRVFVKYERIEEMVS